MYIHIYIYMCLCYMCIHIGMNPVHRHDDDDDDDAAGAADNNDFKMRRARPDAESDCLVSAPSLST